MMPQAARARSPLSWTIAQYVLVVGLSGLLTLWKLGAPALDGHEAYVAVAARTMVTPDHWLNPDIADGPIPANTALNHWLIPVFNGEPRVVKTPLAYWCVAALMKLGSPANEFTARLPSALAAVVLAAVVLALGRRMLPPRAAMLGALMFATSVAVIGWGRNARADMQMMLWMTVSLACFYWAMQQGSALGRHLLIVAAWGALGLANLAKELAPLFMLLPALLYVCWRASLAHNEDGMDESPRGLVRYLIAAAGSYVVCGVIRVVPAIQWWRWAGIGEDLGVAVTMAVALGGPVLGYAVFSRPWRVFRTILPGTLIGVVVMALLFVPWMFYLSRTLPQAAGMLVHQTTERALGTGGWLERCATPLTGYYLTALAKWSLPWVAFLPGALAIPLMKRFLTDRDPLVFLLLWVFGLVLLFSASVGKHEQYILPAMPPVCLLMGYCAEDVFFTHRWISLKFARAILAGYGAVVLLAGAGGLAAMAVVQDRWYAPYVRHVLLIALVALVPACLGVWALVRSRPRLAIALMVLAMVSGELAFVSRASLWNRRWEDYARFGLAIAKEVPQTAELLAWSRPDPAVVWYSRREVPEASKQRARLVRMYGAEAGERMWRQRLSSSQGRLYVVATKTDARELSGLGLEPMAVAVATVSGSCLFRL
ncbi:MAG: glycosyltransferase family 39 protein [Phycisphaerae bacterium]|nr:glycosyltransferase family 39 protein [Phycisphaerae bacterium]